MIAYKVFTLGDRGGLYPYWAPINFTSYPKGYIHIPADGCGPFAAFREKQDALDLATMCDVVHKVKIKPSNKKQLWVTNSWGRVSRRGLKTLFEGTILADEFEILERVR